MNLVLSRREFAAGLGGIVVAFTLAPRLMVEAALAQQPAVRACGRQLLVVGSRRDGKQRIQRLRLSWGLAQEFVHPANERAMLVRPPEPVVKKCRGEIHLASRSAE